MPNKISQFWQELKRRNVVRVITVYGGAAFVIIELINNITEPLRLPEWTPTLVIVLLAIGFPIVVIFSWIYDVHPEGGMVKTQPAEKAKTDEIPRSSSRWKIASYISFVVILGLIVLNIIPRAGKNEVLDKSIAILPVLNLGEDPEQDPMCAVLTSEIISQLSKIKSFDKVVPYQSVMKIEPGVDLLDIAEELGVNYILTTNYSKIGDNFKIHFFLIEPREDKDRTIWLDDLERKYEQIITINSEIALEIARKLNVIISEEEKVRIENVPTENLEAYELIKQAKYLFSKSGFSPHIPELLKRAIELDPGYAEAYALAGGYFLLTGSFAGNVEMHSAALNAMPYLMDAIELDPEISSAHLNLGTYYLWYNWDYIRAEEEYLKALDLEPNNLANISTYLEFLNKMNRPEEVLKLQNIPAYMYSDLAKTQVLLGNNEKAENMMQMYIDSLGGDSFPWIGECYLWMGEYDSAMKYLEPIKESADMNRPRFKACLALSYYYTNQHNKADAVITQLVESSDTSSAGSPNFYAGWYYSGIGQLDSAFYFLEKAYANRSPEFPWLKADPIFKNLGTNPHYWDLYERTGHKAYDDYLASKKQ